MMSSFEIDSSSNGPVQALSQITLSSKLFFLSRNLWLPHRQLFWVMWGK